MRDQSAAEEGADEGSDLVGPTVTKGSTRASSRLQGGSGVTLLPPRLQPMGAEQCAEAVALLSDLLLAVAKRAGDSRGQPTADGVLREDELAA